MIGFIHNVRVLNRPDKLFRTGELINEHRPDFIALSETKKEDFTPSQLQTLDSQGKYFWNWLPAVGTAGGILVGINSDVFDVLSWSLHKFCVCCLITDKSANKTWKFMAVYGTAYDEQKLEFINELHNVLLSWSGPILVGGDFNLVRSREEKSSGVVNQQWVNLFNDWINRFSLLELKIAGRRFTWSNHLENVVMATLDRVFCFYMLG